MKSDCQSFWALSSRRGPITIDENRFVQYSSFKAGKLNISTERSPPYNQTSFEPENSGTRVREYIKIAAPALLMKTTYNGAAVAHKGIV
jgi:hypothetical protein